jgi:hypothetical protein
MLHIYTSVSNVFLRMLQSGFILMFAMATHVVFKFFLAFRKCFRRMLQVFQLFWMYVANVFSICCKSILCYTCCNGTHL